MAAVVDRRSRLPQLALFFSYFHQVLCQTSLGIDAKKIFSVNSKALSVVSIFPNLYVISCFPCQKWFYLILIFPQLSFLAVNWGKVSFSGFNRSVALVFMLANSTCNLFLNFLVFFSVSSQFLLLNMHCYL